MKTYYVTMWKTYEQNTLVEADSQDEASEKAWELWDIKKGDKIKSIMIDGNEEFCPKCNRSYYIHNDNGSCIED